ncbi:class I SAM-dependent methyltransferase [Euryhalocaulis caribicus]|uniref:class I SAM-dependent methyltransferase n=1 Tax=Euryhalocaulis caribicus TaxID=1161401 RepID=UPI0003A706F5|nr:methyltransferase [Euryhalocaulis caribicus]
MSDSFSGEPAALGPIDHANPAARQAFIRSVTRIQSPPLAPELRLYLAHPGFSIWRHSEESLEAAGLPPPFWAFAWAGGQALARYVLDHPNLFHKRNILDFASGCGVTGIAAARAGASVTASELDAYAIDAIALNADLNGADIEGRLGDLVGAPCEWDVILAGDIFYDDTAGAIGGWLSDCAAQGCQVFIGDPGRARLPRQRVEQLAQYEARRSEGLEDQDIRRTRVWRYR